MRLRAVLFDFAETLFAPAVEMDWVRTAADRIGWRIADAEAERLAADIEEAFARPEIAELQHGRDLSAVAHRAALTAAFGSVEGAAAGFAEALYEQLMEPGFWRPYPDVAPTLRRLRARGLAVGVVSNIPWDIRPRFALHGLADAVDVFALSFEHGLEKPDPRLFALALDELGVAPAEALFVGDSPAADGGAVAAGLATLLLPRVEPGSVRGLELVLRLAG